MKTCWDCKNHEVFWDEYDDKIELDGCICNAEDDERHIYCCWEYAPDPIEDAELTCKYFKEDG